MKKIYVLDTNVLLHSAKSLYTFDDNIVIIPDVVIDELDNHKRDKGEVGANARSTARMLEEMCENSNDINGDLLNGYRLETGGIIKVEMNHVDVKMPISWKETNDMRILRVCKGIKTDVESSSCKFNGSEDLDKDTPVILVSNDSYLKIKASLIGVECQSYSAQSISESDELYNGRRVVYVDPSDVTKFYTKSKSNVKFMKFDSDEDAYNYYMGDDISPQDIDEFTENEYVILKSLDGNNSILMRYRDNSLHMLPKDNVDSVVYGIKPKNAGQKFITDALLRDPSECPLVIIKGPAGTGKTLLALAAGLKQVIHDKTYRKILYLRGNIKLDEDIGFLPGTEEEKMEWALRPVRDNLEVILDSSNKLSKMIPDRRDDSTDKKYQLTTDNLINEQCSYFFDKGYISIEAVAHMRGRSIAGTYVIIDEAQNLTPNQVKTLISRASKDTKIVLMGDPYQIDHPYLDFRTNGLCFVSEKMKGSPLVSQITLSEDECERSELSLEISRRMNH